MNVLYYQSITNMSRKKFTDPGFLKGQRFVKGCNEKGSEERKRLGESVLYSYKKFRGTHRTRSREGKSETVIGQQMTSLTNNGVVSKTYVQIERVLSPSRVSGNCVKSQDTVWVF